MAASNLPILTLPPRTPSPLDESSGPAGLGFDAHSPSPIKIDVYDDSREHSPYRGPDSSKTDYMLSPTSATFSAGRSPNGSLYSPLTPQTGNSMDGAFQSMESEDEGGARNPFNFTTQQYAAPSKGSVGRATDIGKRRGHKYRHSSIHTMHQVFQEPTQKTPLAVPASLPMPNRKEMYHSMTTEQTSRLAWCFCHFAASAYVQYAAGGSLAMTALSRLLLFDAAGAVVCVVVDVMGNFEVWKRSSIKHPFGLERADVLAGFGMAVFIAFMGLDVISHGIQHSLENVGSHVPHSPHAHERVSPGSVDVSSLLAIISTLVSALLLGNHARIGRAMRFELIAGWGTILGNPCTFLTLSCSILLLILPLLSIKQYAWFDMALSFVMASMMIVFGARLGTSLASMLLMSYGGKHGSGTIRDVVADIEADPSVSAVEEARFWQVHYGLCMANLKLRYKGGASYGGDEMVRIRQRVASLIRTRLGGGYGSGGAKWEVSTQLALEKD